MLKVLCIVNGYLEENCYIIHNNDSLLIVDPGSESNKIIEVIELLNLKVKGILITHNHFDHIGALQELKNKYNVIVVDNNNRVDNIDEFEFKIIENYGHTLDSISYYFEKDKIMFTGDFVFKETIGNYEEENEYLMLESLNRFKKLDKSITIYPGHGDKSNVSYELKNNPFLRG